MENVFLWQSFGQKAQKDTQNTQTKMGRTKHFEMTKKKAKTIIKINPEQGTK